MRLPTVQVVVAGATAAARRFPLVIAASLVAAWAALSLVHHRTDVTADVRLLTAASLGLPLLFALTVTVERRAGSAIARWGILTLGVLLLVWFWEAWPSWSTELQAFHYVQLSVVFHLMVAFLPYAGFVEPNGFWQYNRELFLRFLTASIYSSVLYMGLAGALLAIDKLLGVHLPSDSYAHLWVVIAFVFNTWFFVGGIPRNLDALDVLDDYPEGLRIFTQYVLVPIVAIYLVILTLYLGKVLITRVWPSGWIGYLVSGVATVGMLSWLLVHPLEERAEYGWVKPFTKGFYIALMPAIVMLWLSIWKRVQQYGITERRYFLIVLSVWLAGIALYYTVGRSRSIKVIPASLCFMALITFAGPWGAYSVSRASQLTRLEAVLARNDLLAGGVLRRSPHDVPPEDRKQISAGFRYLLGTHGQDAINPWLTDSLRHVLTMTHTGGGRMNGEFGARTLMRALNVDYLESWEAGTGQTFGYYSNPSFEAVPISGYTHAMRVSFWTVRDSLKVVDGTWLRLGSDSISLHLIRNGVDALTVALQPIVDSAAAFRRGNGSTAIPSAVLRTEGRSGDIAMLVSLTSLNGWIRPNGSRLTSFEGEVFLKLP